MYFGKHLTTFFAVCLLLLIFFSNSSAQDTTPPVFSVLPKSDSLFCYTANPTTALQTWFNKFGGGTATDNSGMVSIVADKNLTQVQSEFNQLYNLRCDKNRRVFVKFVARDGAGNVSDTVQVYFKINDEVPLIVKQPEFIVPAKSCILGIQDSLITWIKNHGNALVTNGCGGQIIWERFIYSTSAGVAGSGNFENGPFPLIPANACNWSIDISFFVKDSCGNPKTLTGRYKIQDNVPPILDTPLEDITINCSQIPDTIVSFTDFCDPNPKVVFQKTITRIGDSLSCLFYNYALQRKWTATDACGNVAIVNQKVTVLDMEAPVIDAPTELTITCDQLDSLHLTLSGVHDECAKSSWTFSDSILGTGCQYTVLRKYEAMDVCENKSSKIQRLTIIDTVKPLLINAPIAKTIYVSDSAQTKNAFESWLDGLGGMNAVDACSNLDTTILITGTYDTRAISSLIGKRPRLEDFTFCLSGSDTILTTRIDFVIVDQCGNYIISSAALDVIDTLAPVFSSCTTDYGIRVTSPECNNEITIQSPTATDSNYLTTSIFKKIIINDSIDGGSFDQFIQLRLPSGNNKLKFSAKDCAGNEAVCQSKVFVLDSLSPTYRLSLCSNDTLFLKSNLGENIQEEDFGMIWFKENDSIGMGKELILVGAKAELEGNYTLRVFDQNCKIEKSLAVAIGEQSVPLIQGEEGAKCLGQTVRVELENSGVGANYFWFENKGNGWVLLDSTTQNFRTFVLDGDSLMVYGQVKTEQCFSSSSDTLIYKTIRLVVPEIAEGQSIDICEGNSLSLAVKEDQDPVEYFWKGPMAFSSQGANVLVSDTILKSQEGTYQVWSQQEDCVSDTALIQVRVLEKPRINAINGTSSVCNGSDGLVWLATSTEVDSVLWFRDGIYFKSTLIDTLLLKSSLGEVKGAYSALAFEGGCTSLKSKNFVVQSSGNLSVSFIRRGGNCAGDSMRLEATDVLGGNYKWEGPNGITGNNRLFTVSGISGKYSLIVDNGQGCSSRIDSIINIPQRPKILDMSSDYSACLDSVKSFTLSAEVSTPSSDLKYQWFGPAGFRSTAKNPVVNITDGKEFGRYLLEVSLGTCIGFIDTLEVLQAAISERPKIKGEMKACLGDTLFLSASAGYNDYTWDTPKGLVNLSDSIFAISGVGLDDQGIYFVRGKSGSCQSELSDTFLLSIVDRPNIPLIIGLDSICYGDSLMLNIQSPQNNVEYSWRLPTGETIEANPLSIIDLPDKLKGKYTVAAKSGSCMSGLSQAFVVNVKASFPSPTFDIDRISQCDQGNNDIRFCLATVPQDPSLEFIITTIPGQEKLFQGRDSCYLFNTANFSSPVSRIRVQSKKEGCLSDSFDDITMNLAKKPEIDAKIIASSLTLCGTSDTIFLTNEANPDSILYFWRVLDNGIVLENLPENVLKLYNFSKSSNRVILTLTYDICNNFSRDTIDILQAVKPEINQIDTVFLDGNNIMNVPIVLDFPKDVAVSFIENKDGFIEETGQGYEVSILDASAKKVDIQYEVCAGICEGFCDTGTVTIIINEIEIDNLCNIPNVITPNGDGVNDVLQIDCSEQLPNNRLQIFTQWGDGIFIQQPYDNSWQGEYKGAPLPAGTYFYSFDDGNGKVLNGFIILQR